MQEVEGSLIDLPVSDIHPMTLHKQHHATSPRVKQIMLSSTLATGLFFTTPLITEAALGDQPLKEGMSHPDVKQLQEILKAKGYFNYHTATGYYGSITSEAVSAFQRVQGLPQDGQATRATLDQLLSDANAAAVKVSASSSASSSQLLKPGTTSSHVLSLQQQLKKAGYFDQQPTNYYGRVTSEAVRSFQRANQLAVDGIAGPQTLKALQNTTAVTIQSAPAAKPEKANQTIRMGAKGQAVERLQQRLLDLGYYKGSVDGHFSEATLNAVRRLQQQQRLSVDGIVGPQTWNVLKTASAAPNEKPQVPPAPPKETVNSVSPQAPTTSKVLRIGAQNDSVKSVQSQLKVLGLFNQEATGYYGTITEQAVRAFQRQQGLTVDGIAGSSTIERLANLAGETTVSSSEFNVMNVVADASELLGIPYVWGGTSTAGFDCSGFINYVFVKSGIQLPRTVAGMWDRGIVTTEPRVGDIVFFDILSTGPSHAGIYIGNGQFVHSGSSTGVAIGSMNAAYWNDRYLGTKRFH